MEQVWMKQQWEVWVRTIYKLTVAMVAAAMTPITNQLKIHSFLSFIHEG